jgi:serine/threonine protein phosphatase 1
MMNLARFLGIGSGARRARMPRLRLDMTGLAVYAIGDVHGCLDELLALEDIIVRDAQNLPCRGLIVMLGDYVDRGPASAQVLDHLIAPPPPGLERICLAGNHELAMLDYLEGRITRAAWLRMGAEPTLLSYGIDHQRLRDICGGDEQIDDIIRNTIPSAHLTFLRSLTVLIETDRYIFVHAGIRPELELEKQTDDDLVFIRSAFFDKAHLLTRYVIHGHTPTEEARREGMRVNLDTGAFFSGRLTALRIWGDKGRYLTNLSADDSQNQV